MLACICSKMNWALLCPYAGDYLACLSQCPALRHVVWFSPALIVRDCKNFYELGQGKVPVLMVSKVNRHWPRETWVLIWVPFT